MFAEIHRYQGNTQLTGYQFRKNQIIIPGTITGKRTRGIMPIDHEHSGDIITLLYQEIGSNTRIHPTGYTNYNFLFQDSLNFLQR